MFKLCASVGLRVGPVIEVVALTIGLVGLVACHAGGATASPTAMNDQATSGVAVNMNNLRQIPVGGSQNRDFSDGVLLAPTAMRSAGGLSLAGTTAAETRYSLDGATMNSPITGTMRVQIVQDYLQSPAAGVGGLPQ